MQANGPGMFCWLAYHVTPGLKSESVNGARFEDARPIQVKRLQVKGYTARGAK